MVCGIPTVSIPRACKASRKAVSCNARSPASEWMVGMGRVLIREIACSTDETGGAEVKVTAPGRWQVRAIHMIRIDGDPEFSWESYWATLTFEVQSTAGSGW